MVPQQGHLTGELWLEQLAVGGLGQEGGQQEGGQHGGGQGQNDVTRHEGPQLVIGPMQQASTTSRGPFLLMYSDTFVCMYFEFQV